MSDPTALWRLDDNLATSVVLDSIGDAHGVLYDVGGQNNTQNQSTTDAKFVRAFTFVANDVDFFQVDAHPAHIISNLWTMAGWFKTSNNDDEQKTIFAKLTEGAGGWVAIASIFTYAGVDKIRFGVRTVYESGENGFAYYKNYPAGNNALTDNEWHLVVVTYDKNLASNQLKLYLDGYEVSQKSTTGLSTFTNAEAYFVVGFYPTVPRTFDGIIDNVMLWNDEAITPDDIKRLWCESNVPPKARVCGSGRLAAGTGRITPGASRIR